MKTLQTQRLTIRGFETSDLEGLYAVCSNPEVMQFVGDGKPFSREKCEHWIVISNANDERQNFGAMAVIENSSQDFVGYCGLVFGEDTNMPEIIYAFLKSAWHKGYATEAAKAMLEYGFCTLKLESIVASADPNNKASLTILEQKLGFGHTHTQNDIHGLPTAFFKLERTVWLQSQSGLVNA